jgi:hypothetical protein
VGRISLEFTAGIQNSLRRVRLKDYYRRAIRHPVAGLAAFARLGITKAQYGRDAQHSRYATDASVRSFWGHGSFVLLRNKKDGYLFTISLTF